LDIALQFPDLESFQPAGVARQVPALAQLLQIRTLVARVSNREIDLDEFRAQLVETGADADWAGQLYQTLTAPEAPSPQGAAPQGGDTLGRLLGMVSLGDEHSMGDGSAVAPAAPPESSGLMGALIDAVAGEADSKPRVEKSAAKQLLSDLDGILSEQLNAIMGAPGFRTLEAAWRGLKLLVDRIDFRSNIQLDVLAAGKDVLSEALYYQVLLPEHNNDQDTAPLSAVILDFAFSRDAADVELLEDLAESGASLQTPIVASAEPAFFGVAQYGGLTRMSALWQHFEGPEYIAWNKLRQRKEARFLALALPAFVVRYPYGSEKPVKAFSFTEDGQLWANASLAVAVQVADSFSRTGWPTHLRGSDDIGDLPLWSAPQGRTPLAVLIPDGSLSEYMKAGFVVLSGKPNHDGISVARAQTVCLPEAYEDLMAATEAKIHVTLACQLFVARAAHYVILLSENLSMGEDVAQTQQEITKYMRAFFHTEGQLVPQDAVWVEHVPESGLDEHELFAIRLQTPSYILDRRVSLVLGLQLPKNAPA
jgi:type VI secretion system protein ImpC